MGSVRLEGISKKFGNTEVLKDVNLEVKDKEFYCFLGPPGAGKTTIFRVIAGLEKPEEGRVYIDDLDVTDLPPRDRDVAMLFETLALYPTKTGYENIEFPLRLRKVSKAERDERVKNIASLLRIEHVLDRLPKTFSGGEQQRVALAKTLIRKPKAFLLDEPLSNVDALLRIDIELVRKSLGVISRIGVDAIDGADLHTARINAVTAKPGDHPSHFRFLLRPEAGSGGPVF